MAAGASPLNFRITWPRRAPLGILLAAAGVSFVVVLPLIYLVVRALDSGPELGALLLSVRTIEIFLRSLALTAAVTAAAVVLGVPLAWLTVRSDLPLRRFWVVVAVLPLVIPTYVSGLATIIALGPRGMLQGLLAPLGMERFPEIYGLPGAFLILTFHTYPYVMLTVRAALQRLDPATEEASQNLGHGSGETFLRVLLPQLRPSIASGALLAALYTLGDFGAVSMMRYEAFTWAIYIQYESAFDRSLAAALSLVLVAVAAGMLATDALTRGRMQYYRTDPGVSRAGHRVRLRALRWPALVFCGGLGIAAVVLPLAVLVSWAVRGLLVGEPLHLFARAAVTSVYLAALAAVVTLCAALPVAVLSVRYPSTVSRLLESMSYIGFALPRLAIALGLVFFGANYARPFYQTTALLLLAYVILFLPTALGGVTTSLRQVTPHLEEAARSLGRRPWQVFVTVTLPIVFPGIIAGAALVFLLTMEELPATLLLRPPGVDTLATSIWSAASEALFAQAAVPSLVLVALSSLSVGLMFWKEGRA